jgi:hypothetical protein
MPFVEQPIAMSISQAGPTTIVHDTPADSLGPWTVVGISTESGVVLRKTRWTFGQRTEANGDAQAPLSIGASNGTVPDKNLDQLAKDGKFVTLKVSFNGGPKEDLRIKLSR